MPDEIVDDAAEAGLPLDAPAALTLDILRHSAAHLMAAAVDSVGVYRTGEFVDLCRGPHVPDTSLLGVFKLQRVAGVYWRGDERNEQLQRVYGTAWFTEAELDAYLARLAEAERRDHRR